MCLGKKLHSFEYFLHAEVAVFFLRTLQIKGKLPNSRFSLFETGVLVLFGKYNSRVTGLINNLLVRDCDGLDRNTSCRIVFESVV